MSTPLARRLGVALAIVGLLVGVAPSSLAAAPSAGGATIASTSPLHPSRLISRGTINPKALPHRARGSSGRGDHSALRRIPDQFRSGPSTTTSSPRTLATTASSPVAATVTSAPTDVLPGFAGVSSASTGEAGIDPPDPWVAVGPEHIVQAVNLTMRMTRRAGGAPTDAALLDFFGVPSSVPFDSDPRVIFDSAHQRWVATEVSWDCTPGTKGDTAGDATYGHGYLDIAISASADALGDWTSYGLEYTDALPDYPGLGTSTDKVIQSANVFDMAATPAGGDCVTNGQFAGADLPVYDWSDLANGGSLDAGGPFFPGLFTIRPAVQAPATSATGRFLAYGDNGSGGLTWVTGTATGTVHGATGVTASAAVTTLAATPVEPPSPRQPNGIVTTAIDSRLTDAIQQGNRVTAVSTNGCTPAGDSAVRDCVRVTQFDVAANTKPQDFVIGSVGQDNYMGGIGLSTNGTLHVVWTRSSSTTADFPSSYTAYQRTADSANSISPARLIAAGAANHDDGSGAARWGDYVGVAQDPQVPDAVWQADEFATADGAWGTHVSQLQTDGLRYVPVTPVRKLDTRAAMGLSGKFTANSARTFTIIGGSIPTTARAVTANVTVVNQQASGFVAVTPTATNSPSTSTINFPIGDVRANNLTATLSPTGTLSAVYRAASGKTTDLVLDVTGYYVDAAGATFTPMAPVRRLDTRKAIGLANKFQANKARFLLIGGTSGVPTTASAITGNLTVVNQTYRGYLSVTLSDPGTSPPAISNLNFPTKDVRANGVTVALNASHGIWIDYRAAVAATTDVLLDITGYYTNDDSGFRYHPLNPGRIMDTRLGKVLSGLTGKLQSRIPEELATAGHWGVPSDARGVTANLTATAMTYPGYLSVTRDQPSGIPSTSTLNFPDGDTRANGITSALGSPGSLWLDYVSTVSGTSTDAILDLSGYFK